MTLIKVRCYKYYVLFIDLFPGAQFMGGSRKKPSVPTQLDPPLHIPIPGALSNSKEGESRSNGCVYSNFRVTNGWAPEEGGKLGLKLPSVTPNHAPSFY